MLNAQMYAFATNNEKAAYINNNEECIEKEKKKWFFLEKQYEDGAQGSLYMNTITNTFISYYETKMSEKR